ncbi:MAG TPA: hypothetical protein VJ385_03890 [Fibrobacteria bacterium]|nr:hypothetical protein [Fibrobacteria bacterium]
MAKKELVEKIKKIVNEKYALDFNLSDLEILDSGKVSGYVTSGSFKDTLQEDRQKMVWAILKEHLSSDELNEISLILTMTPDELQDDEE